MVVDIVVVAAAVVVVVVAVFVNVYSHAAYTIC